MQAAYCRGQGDGPGERDPLIKSPPPPLDNETRSADCLKVVYGLSTNARSEAGAVCRETRTQRLTNTRTIGTYPPLIVLGPEALPVEETLLVDHADHTNPPSWEPGTGEMDASRNQPTAQAMWSRMVFRHAPDRHLKHNILVVIPKRDCGFYPSPVSTLFLPQPRVTLSRAQEYTVVL